MQPSDFLKQAAVDLNFCFTPLGSDRTAAIRADLIRKFANEGGAVLWQHLSHSASLQDIEAWKRIDLYLKGESFLIFFDQERDNDILEFASGTRLAELIANCPGFEFYVTNIQTSYLLCFNEHDFLIASGDAVDWTSQLPVQA